MAHHSTSIAQLLKLMLRHEFEALAKRHHKGPHPCLSVVRLDTRESSSPPLPHSRIQSPTLSRSSCAVISCSRPAKRSPVPAPNFSPACRLMRRTPPRLTPRSTPDMAAYFKVDMVAVNLTITAYIFGGALGQFFAGALSDHLGRRPLGLVGLLIFTAASLAVTFAIRIEQVWALRVLQALGAGTASVICIAQVRDLYRPEEVARKIANVTLVMLAAGLLARWALPRQAPDAG